MMLLGAGSSVNRMTGFFVCVDGARVGAWAAVLVPLVLSGTDTVIG